VSETKLTRNVEHSTPRAGQFEYRSQARHKRALHCRQDVRPLSDDRPPLRMRHPGRKAVCSHERRCVKIREFRCFLFLTATIFGTHGEQMFPRPFQLSPIDKMSNHVSMSTSLYLSSALLRLAYVIVTLIGLFLFLFFSSEAVCSLRMTQLPDLSTR
jgi:hypothetical protein